MIKEISGSELEKFLEEGNYKLVDVRKKEQYDQGHIDKAVNIPLDRIDDEIDLEKDENIIVYCNTGKTSSKAAKLLSDLGYENIYNAPGVKNYSYKNIVK